MAEKRFKGWGVEELCEAWGLPIEPWETHKERLSEYMYAQMSIDEDDSNMKKHAADLREFLEVLAAEEEKVGYYAPLWRGLRAIESDWSLLKIGSVLVPYMWS